MRLVQANSFQKAQASRLCARACSNADTTEGVLGRSFGKPLPGLSTTVLARQVKRVTRRSESGRAWQPKLPNRLEPTSGGACEVKKDVRVRFVLTVKALPAERAKAARRRGGSAHAASQDALASKSLNDAGHAIERKRG